MKDWTLEDLAKELANYWYQEAKYTANGRWEECYEEALKILTTKIAEERLDEAKHYCDKGHYHDKDRDLAMLPSERIAELEAGLKGDG